MNYVNEQNMQEILNGIARKIGQGSTGAGLEDWQASHEYTYNDICVYEGQIYRAKVGFTSDTTFNTTQILEEYTPTGEETIIPYEKDTEINIDDIVSYDNNTYKALYNFVCGEEFSLYALQEYVPQELTTEDIKQIIDAYNPVFEEAKGIEYSTEERRIGTWVDGKPLYQKTFSVPFNNIEVGSRVWIPILSLEGLYDIKECNGYLDIKSDNIGHYLLPNVYVADSGSTNIAMCQPSSGSRTFSCLLVNYYSSSALSGNIVLTLQYTKTTD